MQIVDTHPPAPSRGPVVNRNIAESWPTSRWCWKKWMTRGRTRGAGGVYCTANAWGCLDSYVQVLNIGEWMDVSG